MIIPLRRLLTQGASPDRIAATLATGTVCTLCPIFGTTTLLNIAAGVCLRMNHPILQALNQLLGPLQLVMMVVYVRVGDWLFGREGDEFTLAAITRTLDEGTLADVLEKFGRAGLHGLFVWLMTAPLLFGMVYLPSRVLVHRFILAKRRTANS